MLTGSMSPDQVDSILQRYLAMWHEPDTARRHALVAGLWAADAANYSRRFAFHGLAEIVERVDRAHAEWVATKGFRFQPTGNTDAHNNIIKFCWQMVPRDGGAVDSRGLDILIVQDDGRLAAVYHFAEPAPVA